MELRAAKLEASDDVVDNPRESAKITSRARSRIAELLQKPFDVRSISLTGLFILGLFYTIYFMRSILLPIKSVPSASALTTRFDLSSLIFSTSTLLTSATEQQTRFASYVV